MLVEEHSSVSMLIRGVTLYVAGSYNRDFLIKPFWYFKMLFLDFYIL
jgi:hypothetical protein